MFLLPSVFILFLFILGLVFLIIFSKKKIGLSLIILAVVLYYFFSITPVSNLLIYPLEVRYEVLNEDAFQNISKIVLLTGGVKEDLYPLNSKLYESTLYRTVGALEVFLKREAIPTIIISGTSPILPEVRDGIVISEFLRSFGVPDEKIILEDSSRNTYQAAQELKSVVGKDPFLLVTSAYHMPRSVYAFEKEGLYPVPFPVDFKMEKAATILDFFPNPKNLRKSDLAFHEYFGLIYYKMKK